jgi:hypothetical protein
MVPVFALFRLGAYVLYLRSNPRGERSEVISRGIRVAAAGLLVVSSAVPLYRTSKGTVTGWQFALEDAPSFVLMAFAFLWPLVAILSRRLAGRRTIAITVQLAEPVLAACSTLLLMWVPQLVWDYETTFAPWLIVPLPARTQVGAVLAVLANGAYVLGWLVGLIRQDTRGS